MFVRVRTRIADECNVPGSHARLSSAACLSAKRQLGPKSATTSRPSARLIACVEACVALTDGWGGGRLEGGPVGVGLLADAGCVLYTVSSSLRPITLIRNLPCQATSSHLYTLEILHRAILFQAKRFKSYCRCCFF